MSITTSLPTPGTVRTHASTQEFADDDEAINQARHDAQVLRAIGNPLRLLIVSLLARSHAYLCVKEITDKLSCEQPETSRSLKILYKAGLVDRHMIRRGHYHHYCLRGGAYARVESIIGRRLLRCGGGE